MNTNAKLPFFLIPRNHHRHPGPARISSTGKKQNLKAKAEMELPEGPGGYLKKANRGKAFTDLLTFVDVLLG